MLIDKCYENRVFFLVINDGKFIKFYEFFEKLIVICVDEKEERIVVSIIDGIYVFSLFFLYE